MGWPSLGANPPPVKRVYIMMFLAKNKIISHMILFIYQLFLMACHNVDENKFIFSERKCSLPNNKTGAQHPSGSVSSLIFVYDKGKSLMGDNGYGSNTSIIFDAMTQLDHSSGGLIKQQISNVASVSGHNLENIIRGKVGRIDITDVYNIDAKLRIVGDDKHYVYIDDDGKYLSYESCDENSKKYVIPYCEMTYISGNIGVRFWYRLEKSAAAHVYAKKIVEEFLEYCRDGDD